MARSVRNRACTRHLHRDAANACAPSLLRRVKRPLLAALLGVWTAASLASTASPHKPAESPYSQAERARQALEARPEDQRTRRDYERVLELYRAIYHDDPASPKADASIFAVAQLLAEQGRVLKDEKSLHDAIGQYEFLRREYPSSRYRADALLAEGGIYLRNLNDNAAAKSTYQAFLKEYPRNQGATEARAGLKELHADEVATRHPINQSAPISTASRGATPTATATAQPAHQKHSNTVLTAAIQSQAEQPPSPTPQPASPQPATHTPATSPPPIYSAARPATVSPTATRQATAPESAPTQVAVPSDYQEPPHRKGKLVQVTGVRHWSTSIYTRVAIDLGDEVQYEAARVPDPDRIFFDLHGARLSPELIGKSVTVIDDGFLKRIRIAQFSNDVTRVVLDVSDVSDYSAFLLPNPYRLIIDIHGRKPGTAATQQLAQTPPAISPVPTASKPQPSSAPDSSTPATGRPQSAPVQANRQSATIVVTNPAPTSTETAATQDIAALSHQPDRVKATNHPTSAPIAASVAGTTPASQPDLAPTKSTAPTPKTKRSKTAETTDASDPASSAIHEAEPTADGGRSMVRALGLKIGRIVIDPGHGGHDSGTLGPDGIEEKDVVLDVSLRLGKLLKQRLGADVIFTRSDDTFIPLETRTAIANKAQADLFVSVHANSSPDPSARGVETYYLNFTSSPESLELAARENAVSQQSIHQLSDLVKKIALHDKIDESREFASDVEKYLYEGLDQGNPGLKDRGVKQAPFVVLIGANMPSILAEISFLTNPDDAHQLRDPNYRQRIAESLYRGVARYISGLSGVRLAENSTHLPSN
jgi:N-acetylmuramoyl-L-alanine amidase